MFRLCRSWLNRALRKPALQAAPSTGAEIVLYTRNGCHLCEDALALLQDTQRRIPFRLAVMDIDQEPCLREQYDQCVPVVTVNGKLRFRGRVNKVLLERLLRAP